MLPLPMARPELVAHRGLAAHCPENTLAAFRAAVAAGARWLECDVQLSSDGVPFLFHDRTLARLCGVGGTVHERTAAELDRIPAAYAERFGERFAREPIARLAALVDFLREHAGVSVFVELKRAALERFGSAMVLERVLALLAPVERRAVLISFAVPALLEARRLSRLPVGAVFERWSSQDDAAVARLAPEYLFCDVQGLPRAGELRRPGARVAVYEVAEARVALALAERGVELIESFDVAALGSALDAELGGSRA